MALTADNTNVSSSQTSTPNPQAAPSASSFGASQLSGGVQPGTATSLLTSPNGIKLASGSISEANLNTTPATIGTHATTTVQPITPAKHHVSAPLLCFAGLLIIAAIVLFWTSGRSVKTTT